MVPCTVLSVVWLVATSSGDNSLGSVFVSLPASSAVSATWYAVAVAVSVVAGDGCCVFVCDEAGWGCSLEVGNEDSLACGESSLVTPAEVLPGGSEAVTELLGGPESITELLGGPESVTELSLGESVHELSLGGPESVTELSGESVHELSLCGPESVTELSSGGPESVTELSSGESVHELSGGLESGDTPSNSSVSSVVKLSEV